MNRKTWTKLGEVAVLLGGALSGCTFSDEQLTAASLGLAIQRGQVEQNYPAVGVLPSRAYPSGYCTGTLIDPSWVLTARHCNFAPEFWLGTSKMDFVKYTVDDRITHPSFDRDLELLHLAEPVPAERLADAHVELRQLLDPNPGGLPTDQQECTGVGFGKHRGEDGLTTKGIKRSCTMSVASADQNLIEMELVTGIPDNHDSGGPLICNGSIAAVVKSHRGEWPDYTRETYTTVDTAWVRDTIAGYTGRVAPRQSTSAEIQLVSYEGSLCPPGSLALRGNTVVSDPRAAPISSADPLPCSLELALKLPTDKKLDRAMVCPYFELYDLDGVASVDFDYSVAGAAVDDRPFEVSAKADIAGACRQLILNAATCGAAPGTTVPIHIELDAQIASGTPFRFVSLDHMVESSEGAFWSQCSASSN